MVFFRCIVFLGRKTMVSKKESLRYGRIWMRM